MSTQMYDVKPPLVYAQSFTQLYIYTGIDTY